MCFVCLHSKIKFYTNFLNTAVICDVKLNKIICTVTMEVLFAFQKATAGYEDWAFR